jgi:acyl-CoA synthetase (AMP-forming)/AMP-acid ligase II
MDSLYKCEREDVFTPDGYYRTGDLGYVEAGKYYFRSRMKDMIKTKGANVAPAEVESVLNSCPEVRIAFVVGVPHDVYGQEVIAAVVPEDGRTVDVDVLVSECRRVLSTYKVPSMIEVLAPDEVPQLPSSKPDRRAVLALLTERRAGR